MEAEADPLLGRTLDGKYQLHDRLGEGGMGAVYRATHTLMGKPCAVKVLRGPQAASELAWKRFQREAQSASRLDHEHIIRVTDFGRTADGVAYLVMELLEGRSLAEALAASGALPVARAVTLARQVASALAHAHGLGVVHRDLKPDNIMLVERGGEERVKVLDFGLAKLVERSRADGRRLTTLSEVGSVFGTPEYMSPEQAQGETVDARADLYALGVVLYQMLTGTLPFQGASFLSVLHRHVTEAPVSPAARRPDLRLPEAAVALVMRCLEKDPAKRPAGAKEVEEELAGMQVDPAPPRVPGAVAESPTEELSAVNAVAFEEELVERPRARWPLWVAAGVLVVGVAGAVVMAGVREETRPAPAPEPLSAPAPAPEPLPAPAPAPEPLPASASDADAGTVPLPPEVTPVKRSRAEDHLAAAARYRKAGNRIKELFHLQQALKSEPDHGEALVAMGKALIENGQKELGCQRLARAGAAARSLYRSSGCGSD
jgi:serine/threonine-protein kinase